MFGSKESVNYVHCAMHYNKFTTVETSSKIQKAAKKTYQLFVFCCGVICAHNLKISQKLAKLLEKLKVKTFKHSKMSVSAGNMSNELKYEYYLIIKLEK